MTLLEQEGALVDYSDPLVPRLTIGDVTRKPVSLDSLSLDLDLVVVVVRNPAWPVDAVVASGVPVFDAVNAFGALPGSHHERL